MTSGVSTMTELPDQIFGAITDQIAGKLKSWHPDKEAQKWKVYGCEHRTRYASD